MVKLKSKRAITTAVAAIIVVIAVVAAVVVTYYYVTVSPPPKPEVKHVILQLDWLPYGGHIEFYVAKEKFWPDLGLDVTIVRGTGSGDTVKKVGMGIAEFGWATFDAGVKLRATESILIKVIWAPFQKNDNGLVYIKGRDAGRGPIDLKADIKTLEGKIYGEPAWSSITLQLPAFCAKVGVDYGTITVLHMDPAATQPALIAGDIDAHGATVGDAPGYIASAAEEGLTGEFIAFGDYGLDMISDSMWTSERLITEDPDLVARFVEGLQKGFKWTAENLDEAAQIMAKHVVGYPADIAKEEWIAKGSYTVDKASIEAHGIGWLDPTLVEECVENVYVMYGISEERYLASPTEAFTNEFIQSDIYPATWPW